MISMVAADPTTPSQQFCCSRCEMNSRIIPHCGVCEEKGSLKTRRLPLSIMVATPAPAAVGSCSSSRRQHGDMAGADFRGVMLILQGDITKYTEKTPGLLM